MTQFAEDLSTYLQQLFESIQKFSRTKFTDPAVINVSRERYDWVCEQYRIWQQSQFFGRIVNINISGSPANNRLIRNEPLYGMHSHDGQIWSIWGIPLQPTPELPYKDGTDTLVQGDEVQLTSVDAYYKPHDRLAKKAGELAEIVGVRLAHPVDPALHKGRDSLPVFVVRFDDGREEWVPIEDALKEKRLVPMACYE
jgi:hypothetical protein